MRKPAATFRLTDQLHAAVDFEGSNARAPVKRTIGFQILRGVPESAIIDRINTHVTVIAPTAQRTRLRAGALHNGGLITQRIDGVTGEARGVANGGFDE